MVDKDQLDSLNQPVETIHALEEISVNLLVYREPEMLLEDARKRIDVSRVNNRDLDRYTQLLSYIRYAWEKTKKYEIYFSDFFTCNDKIDPVEALNHHIHAYLQDMDTFKNKIETFLNSLKKDAIAMAVNKKEVADFFSQATKKTTETFRGMTEIRNPHTHHGMRFMDGDLLKAENAQNAARQIQSPLIASNINQSMIPAFLERMSKEKQEGFENAKKRWIQNAARNNIQTTGFLNGILKAVEAPLYQFLKIVPTKDLFPR